MNKIALNIAVFVALSFSLASTAQAADRFWVGGGTGDSDVWELTGNWSSQEKGAGGASVPGASDIAIFSASGNTVQIRSAVSVAGIEVKPTWTGSILQGTGTLTIGSSNFRMGSGAFVGGDGTIDLAGNYTQTGGRVTVSQGTMTIAGNFSLTDGAGTGIPDPSFTSTGTLTFDGTADQTFTRGATTTLLLENLTINNSGGGTSDDIVADLNGGLNMSGSLTVTVGNLDLDTNDVAMVLSGITIANDAQATLITGGNVTASGNIAVGAAGAFTMNGTTTLTMNGQIQTLDSNNTQFVNVTIASLTSTTLVTSHTRLSTTLQINTGSTLNLGALVLAVTGGTVINYATLTESTGKLVHTATNFLITNSSYTELSSFTAGDTIYFTLTEDDENIDGTAADTVSITVSTPSDSESVTLTEVNNTERIFRGSIPTSNGVVTGGDGILQIPSPETITATFTDAQDALTNTDTIDSSGVTTGGGGGGRRARLKRLREAWLLVGTRNVDESTEDDSSIEDQTTEPSEDTEEPVILEPEPEPKITFVLPRQRGKLQVTIDGKVVVFDDIPVDAWFASHVYFATQVGIASGYKDNRGRLTGKFGPASPVTFAELAKMALETADKNVASVSAVPVNRSARGQWSEKYISLAESLQLSMYTGQLDVNTPASRGAVVQTIIEALNLEAPSRANVFSDLSSSHPQAKAIGIAYELGIISGDTDSEGNLLGTIRADDPINRAEVAKILLKALELDLQ